MYDAAPSMLLARCDRERGMGALDDTPPMPGVEVLRVTQLQGGEELSRLALACPRVRQVILTSAPDRTIDADRYADVFPDAEIIVDLRV